MLDLAPSLLSSIDMVEGARLWSECGVAELTGRHNGPALSGPVGTAAGMRALGERLAGLAHRFGARVDIDGPPLLVERARITGHRRQGDVSVGGACRLLEAADGWVAVSLARDDDLLAVPAWLEADIDGHNVVALGKVVSRRESAWLTERAAWLGIPCAALGEVQTGKVAAHQLGGAPPLQSLDGIVVVDLSSLWAGPLCGRLLAAAGATVVKVESRTRPDGARRGPAEFFALMNSAKQHVVLDLAGPSGRAELAKLLQRADVVIEASRPRALEQMGFDAWTSPARVWLSITAFGRSQPMRVGFGDDAAVAAGLVATDERGPVFAGDAIADPITGLVGAVAVLDRLLSGGRWLIDLPLAQAARLVSGL